jgi:SpoU rRNA methylase family enzyme
MIRARNAIDEQVQDCVANAEMLLSIMAAIAQQTHSIDTTRNVFSLCVLEDLSVALNIITARVPVIANTRHASRQTRPHSQKERKICFITQITPLYCKL